MLLLYSVFNLTQVVFVLFFQAHKSPTNQSSWTRLLAAPLIASVRGQDHAAPPSLVLLQTSSLAAVRLRSSGAQSRNPSARVRCRQTATPSAPLQRRLFRSPCRGRKPSQPLAQNSTPIPSEPQAFASGA